MVGGTTLENSVLSTWPLIPAFRCSGAWVFEHNLFKNKQVCTLVLVDELQAGLADGDIYLSVYLKEVWFKSFSFRFIYLCAGCVCVCVSMCVRTCVCVKGKHTSPTVLTVRSSSPRCILTPPGLSKCLEGPKEN